MWAMRTAHRRRTKRTTNEDGRLLGSGTRHGTPRTLVRDMRTTMVIVRFRSGTCVGECLISTDVQANRGPGTNHGI